jgi:hypothetical protein
MLSSFYTIKFPITEIPYILKALSKYTKKIYKDIFAENYWYVFLNFIDYRITNLLKKLLYSR